jgi:ankyrin repeat protein
MKTRVTLLLLAFAAISADLLACAQKQDRQGDTDRQPESTEAEWGVLEAAMTGDMESLKRLVQEGENVNIMDEKGRTPLHLAAEGADLETLKVLARGGADLNAQDHDGNTPLDKATDACRYDVMAYLYGQGARFGRHAGNLAYLAAVGDNREIGELVAAGADVNARSAEEYRTPLHYAAERGNRELVKLLVDAGAEVDAKDWYGTLLHLAIKGGHRETVEVLINAGADVNQRYVQTQSGHSCTPLHLAADAGNVGIAELLIVSGADPNGKDKWHGSSVLHYAARSGRKEMVQLLIAEGADLNATDVGCNTPLDVASDSGTEQVLRLHGALKGCELRSDEEIEEATR